MSTAFSFGHLIEAGIFPLNCALCDLPLTRHEREGLCAYCINKLSIEPETSCQYCGRPLIVENELCLDCRNSPPPNYDRIIALYDYHKAGKQLLAAYKFGEHRSLVHHFARLITNILKNPIYNPESTLIIVPVPPRPGKLKKTGWDQVDFLTKTLKKQGLPVFRCLQRLESTTQKTLNRLERQQNMRGKIKCLTKPPADLVLIDDVITTGATLNTCAEALKTAGSKTVLAITLCFN